MPLTPGPMYLCYNPKFSSDRTIPYQNKLVGFCRGLNFFFIWNWVQQHQIFYWTNPYKSFYNGKQKQILKDYLWIAMSLLFAMENGNWRCNSSGNMVAPCIFPWGNGHHSMQQVIIIFLQMIECIFWKCTQNTLPMRVTWWIKCLFFCNLIVRSTITRVSLPFVSKILFYAMLFLKLFLQVTQSHCISYSLGLSVKNLSSPLVMFPDCT